MINVKCRMTKLEDTPIGAVMLHVIRRSNSYILHLSFYILHFLLMSKKILILGTAYPFRGGLAAYNERLATELQLTDEVDIWTFTVQYPGFLFPGKSQYATDPPPPHLRIRRLINSVNPLNWWSTG